MKWRFNLGMLAIGAVLFASCSSNDDLFDPEKAAQRREAQYTTAFAKLYGKIAPDQAWGFGETAETRTANTNSNQWEDYTVVPGVITIEELEAVTTHFSQKLSPESSVKVDWTDFFVQHVYSGHSNMDYLVAANDDHINNFNATNGSIMLMVNILNNIR